MSDAVRFLVGLGNPEPKYAGTRHNLGFWLARECADALEKRGAQSWPVGSTNWDLSDQCLWRRFRYKGSEIVILLPQTFMNRSGDGVLPWARRMGVNNPGNMVVLHDELDLDPGVFRLKTGGGNGGHNGLRSLEDSLQTLWKDDVGKFHRIRLGIGHPIRNPAPTRTRDVANYVLEQLSEDEKAAWAQARDKAVDATLMCLEGRIREAMNQFHVKSVKELK